MLDHFFSFYSAKIATESSKKDQQDEIRRDEHIMKILKAANKLPMKKVRTEKDINEFFED